MGDVLAQSVIWGHYFTGDGWFVKNYVLAYMWKNIAMANGKSNENVMLNLLERRFMTREQIAEAQRLAVLELDVCRSAAAVADDRRVRHEQLSRQAARPWHLLAALGAAAP